MNTPSVSTFIVKTLSGVGISTRTWTIGSAHDPYQADWIEMADERGNVARLYRDGLGQYKTEFEYAHGGTAEPSKWFDSSPHAVANLEYANGQAKVIFGMTFDEAQELSDNTRAEQGPDPMDKAYAGYR